MDFIPLLKAVANTRVKVAFLVGVAVATCLPHAIVGASTHIGLPSATTLLVSSFWPALGAFLLYVTYQFLPRGIVWSLRVLGPGKRRYTAVVVGIWVLAASVVGVLGWPEERVVLGTARLVLVAAGAVGVVALMLAASGLKPGVFDRVGDPELHDDAEIAAQARAATLTLVLSSAVVMVLLVWNVMARLPLGVGGLAGPCVRVAVSAADLPAGVRDVLLGKLAQ